MSEQVADYVSCVRAQGAQLGAERGQRVSAEVGNLGVKAGGAAEISEALQKKYSASDQAMLAIIQACSSTAGVGATSGPARASAKNLAAHWTFDETGGTGASDASGHGNTGRIQGSTTWVTGRVGGALKLEGHELIEVDDNPTQHSPRALTLTAWFLLTKRDLGHPWRDIIIKTNPKGPNWWGCVSQGESDPNPCDEREYGAAINVDDRSFLVYAVTEDHYRNGGQTVCTTPNGTVQFERWQAFAGVISSKSRAIRIYLDGSLVTTCPLSEAGLRRTSQALRIGTNWTGMLDDLRIYDGELADEEIRRLANVK